MTSYSSYLLCDLYYNLLKIISKMSRKCVNSRDTFCYVCGEYTLKSQRKTISPLIRKAYELYFGCKVGDQDKSWAPHICCSSCAANLRTWLNGSRSSMPFAISMIWREQKDYVNDCYFCLTNVSGYSTKNKKAIEYPNLPSAMQSVLRDDTLPMPRPLAQWILLAHHGITWMLNMTVTIILTLSQLHIMSPT